MDRTVGINSDYIETDDYKMQDADREFCIQQGRRAMISFLKHYVHKNNLKKRITPQADGDKITVYEVQKSAWSFPKLSLSEV